MSKQLSFRHKFLEKHLKTEPFTGGAGLFLFRSLYKYPLTMAVDGFIFYLEDYLNV